MIKVYVKADLPPHLVKKWLQYVRDFDTIHKGCKFEMIVDGPDMKTEDAIKILQVSPQFSVIINKDW